MSEKELVFKSSSQKELEDVEKWLIRCNYKMTVQASEKLGHIKAKEKSYNQKAEEYKSSVRDSGGI